jgi:AsmA protein
MKKWIIAAGILLLLVVGAIAWAALNLESYLEENRELVETKISEALGRSVGFDRLALSLRGGLGVRVENLSVGDDPAYGEEPFVTTAAAVARVRIWPALRGEIDVARISLLEPRVRLIRDAAGWNAQTIAATGDEAPEASEPADTSGTAAVAVALFDIEDGTLLFVDRTAKPEFETTFENIDFRASELSPDTPVRIEMSASLLGASDENFSLRGTIGPVDFAAPDTSPLDLELQLGPLDGETAIRFGRGFGAPAEASLQGEIGAEAVVTGTPADPRMELLLDATRAAVGYGDSFQKPQGVPLTFACQATTSVETAEFHSWKLQIAETELDGTAKLGLGEAGEYRATVHSDASAIAPLLALAGALADAEVSGTVGMDLEIDGNARGSGPNADGEIVLSDVGVSMQGAPTIHDYSTRILISSDSAVLEPAPIGIGESEARFDATVRNFDNPQLGFSLESASLALADLDAATFAAGGGDVLSGLTLKGDAVTADDGMDFTAKLEAKSGSVNGIDFNALNAKLRYANGTATLDPLTMQAYGGKLAGKGNYEQPESGEPRFSVELQATGLEAAKVVSAQTAGGSLIEGKIDGRLAADGTGAAWETIQTTLDGNGSFSVTGGRIRDVNVAEEVLQGITGLPGLSSLRSPELKRKHPGVFSSGDTTFRDLTSKFTVADGRMSTKNLDLEASDYGISGAGSIGLDGSVDMSANFRASQALTRSLVSEVDAVKYLADDSGAVEIPFRLTGTLPALRAQPDTRILGKALEGALVGGLVDQLFGLPKPDAPASDPPPIKSGSGGSKKKKKKK